MALRVKTAQTVPPGPGNSTFMNFPLCLDLERLDAYFAILGIPYGAPYGDDDIPNDQAAAPTAVRRESLRLCMGIDHWDFDLDGPLFNDHEIRAVDCGDIPGNPADTRQHYQVHEEGMDKILERFPKDESYYITIDADGLDPAVMPAVAAPAAGGLSFHHVRKLIHGLANIGRLVGMDIVEITPSRDINGITSLTAGQIILNFIGAGMRAAYPPS